MTTVEVVVASGGFRNWSLRRPLSGDGLWSQVVADLSRSRLTILAALGLGVLLILGATADVLADVAFASAFQRQDLAHAYSAPSLATPALWLGTDELGRSQVVRLLYGARITLAVSGAAAFLNIVVGVSAGLVGGYFRGWIDDLTQWAISTLQAIPRLVLLVAISALFTPGPVLLVVVLALLSWTRTALFVRGQTLGLRQREFVVAARVLGATDTRVVLRHMLPNLVPFVCTLIAIDIGGLVLLESALSFLGLGIQAPLPSWGNMLSNAATSFSRGPWLVYCPTLAISLTVLCLYLLGDGLRDALDPRYTRRPKP